MEVLAKKKGVNRVRPSIDLPYRYWVGRKPGQIEHRIGTNYARIYLEKSLKSWEIKHSWEYEPQYYDILRPDGFMAIKNITTNKLKCLFVEFDRCFDPFDKVQKYNELYANSGFTGAWWAKLVDRFPAILVVSEDVGRAQKQLKYNKHNLEFRFMDYRQIKEGFAR